jgi:uncharacterized protein YheU (UPF0270 family)
MAEPAKSTHPTASVELEDDHVVIRDLSMDGALADLVRVGIEHGRDPEAIVREAIEVGAAVLVHGAAKSTVDAVGAEVDRLLTALNERSLRIESLGRMAGKVAAKGLVYEAELGVALETCFAPHQDVLEATGATTGTADDKVGDFVATLNPKQTGGRRLRVVIEAKDRPLSMPKTLAELDAAMLNRGAVVGVIVFRDQRLAPIAGRSLRCLPGNKIIVVWEGTDAGNDLALEVAVQLARTLAMTGEREDAKLNRKILGDRIARLVNIVESADDIQRGIRGARKALDSTEDAYQAMRDDALAVLYELQDRL